jgi:hypothetical protein
MSGIWSGDSQRSTKFDKHSIATRDIVCFEVLDYDSLTRVQISGVSHNVTALIYKKVTIHHAQDRLFAFYNSYKDTLLKVQQCPVVIPLLINDSPASDVYEYSGKRTIEYKLCLVIDKEVIKKDLGTLVIEVKGTYTLTGSYKELIEGGSDPEGAYQTYKTTITGPTFTVEGDRLYGVSVSCGKKLVTFTYDTEEAIQPITFIHDSPINLEDYSEHWKKKKRVVGVLNYYGKGDSREFDPLKFADSVLAVNYADIERMFTL